MYTVLVPIDQSVERGLKQAEYVASLPDAGESVHAVLLYVFDDDDPELPDEMKSFKNATRIESVKRASEHLEEAGVETTVLDDSGEAAQDILDHARDHDVEAIVLGGRKRSPTKKAIFGSVTQEVILDSDRPVVVTGGGPGEE